MNVQPDQLADVALDALPVAVMIADGTATVIKRNRAAEQLLAAGGPLAEVLGEVTEDGREVDWAGELSRLADCGEPVSFSQLRLQTPAGGSRLVDLHLSLLDGVTGAVLAVIEDVGDRASMTRRLATTERMAAVGKLASKVAHELNNPLDGILRFLGLAERAAEDGDAGKGREYIRKARDGVRRMGRIVSELLDYSRAAGRRIEWLPIGAAVEQALEAMAPHLEAAAVTVVCDLNVGDRCRVPGEMFQVICNLIKNAVDAMPSGGRLTVTAACADGCDVLTVADTGDGVPPDVLAKAFDAFFTTKNARSGTGLGLSICRDIVSRAGGTISLANADGGGALVTLTLPHQKPGKETPDE